MTLTQIGKEASETILITEPRTLQHRTKDHHHEIVNPKTSSALAANRLTSKGIPPALGTSSSNSVEQTESLGGNMETRGLWQFLEGF